MPGCTGCSEGRGPSHIFFSSFRFQPVARRRTWSRRPSLTEVTVQMRGGPGTFGSEWGFGRELQGREKITAWPQHINGRRRCSMKQAGPLENRIPPAEYQTRTPRIMHVRLRTGWVTAQKAPGEHNLRQADRLHKNFETE